MNEFSGQHRDPPKGRVAFRDGDDVFRHEHDAHERIIAAARAAFAERGFKGSTIRQITADAQVNLGAITYHFGSKQQLYNAVLARVIGALATNVLAIVKQDTPPMARIERIIRRVFAHMRANPDLPAIMVRELASGREIAEPIRRNFGTLLPAFARVIAEGQADGTIRPADPVLLALSAIAQPVYLNLARPVITAIAGIDPTDESVVDHAVATVRAALENRP